jgi:hypothetical protein
MKILWIMVAALFVAVLSIPLFDGMVDEEVAPRDRTGESTSVVADPVGNPTETRTGSMYRWRDENGVLHIESTPPHGIPFEEIEYHHRAVASGEESQSGASTPPVASHPEGRESPLWPYSRGGMERLLDEAARTAKKLEDRQRVIDELKGDF